MEMFKFKTLYRNTLESKRDYKIKLKTLFSDLNFPLWLKSKGYKKKNIDTKMFNLDRKVPNFKSD